MRVTSFVAAAFVLVLAGSVFAQEPWAESSSPRDGFRITFPGTPKVEEVTRTSQMGYPLPARVFTVDRGREHYSVTVADSRGIEKLGIAKSQSCTPGTETCIGGQTVRDSEARSDKGSSSSLVGLRRELRCLPNRSRGERHDHQDPEPPSCPTG